MDKDLIPIDDDGRKAIAAVGGTATAGAVIGSVVPGVGTAIGAGAGAIVGGIGIIVKKVIDKRNE